MEKEEKYVLTQIGFTDVVFIINALVKESLLKGNLVVSRVCRYERSIRSAEKGEHMIMWG